jgi:hypothetical protein
MNGLHGPTALSRFFFGFLGHGSFLLSCGATLDKVFEAQLTCHATLLNFFTVNLSFLRVEKTLRRV